jgi:acyl-CoA thioesterase-1
MQIKKKSFYLFGDSICYGQLVSPDLTWAMALSTAINNLSIFEGNVLLQNTGVNGNTTRQALERMHYDVTFYSPDYLMIQFGMNDCNYWLTDIQLPRVSPKAFVANLEEMVLRALASGTRHVFLNTNHPSLKGKFPHVSKKSYDQSNAEYSELVRVAHSNMVKDQLPVTLIDLEAAWNRKLHEKTVGSLDSLLLADGIHLSVSGHKLYAEVVLPVVTALLISEGS